MKLRLPVLLLVPVLLTACQPETPEAPAAQGQPPMPKVVVESAALEQLTDTNSYTGRLQAIERVELRPRVSGYLEEVMLKPGATVSAGDTLFRIDTRTFESEVKRLQADIRSAEARLSQARNDRSRATKLRSQEAIAVEQLENRTTAVLEAEATLEALRAALENARLNLSFATVTAPISGQASRALVTAGNYVAAGQTVLTTLVSTDALHAYFDMEEGTYLRLLREAGGDLMGNPVSMTLADGQSYPRKGEIDFIDNSIDPGTGTIRLRARFADENNLLTPGQFVRLELASGKSREVILVPEKAIATDLANRYVLVVDTDNVLQYRPVSLGRKIGSKRVVTEGIQPGDRVVIEGLQKAFPGMPVEAINAEKAAQGGDAA